MQGQLARPGQRVREPAVSLARHNAATLGPAAHIRFGGRSSAVGRLQESSYIAPPCTPCARPEMLCPWCCASYRPIPVYAIWVSFCISRGLAVDMTSAPTPRMARASQALPPQNRTLRAYKPARARPAAPSLRSQRGLPPRVEAPGALRALAPRAEMAARAARPCAMGIA